MRGRHEAPGIRHVLRVPHARSVAPAPHVGPPTLATTFAAPPFSPPLPHRPAAGRRRPRRLETRGAAGASEPRPPAPSPGPGAPAGACALGSPPPA